MDELLEDIERVTDILNMLKSRFFLLRAKYDSEQQNAQTEHSTDNVQTDYQYASKDLQSYIMLELHLLENACTYGIFSMNMYATRMKTNLLENDKDPHFLVLLKENLRKLIDTNKEISDYGLDTHSNFHSYINAFMEHANVLNGISVPDTTLLDTEVDKKKKIKLEKKIAKINLMANIITFFVSDKITDYRTDEGRASLNMALKYRTPRSLEYYTNKAKSRTNN